MSVHSFHGASHLKSLRLGKVEDHGVNSLPPMQCGPHTPKQFYKHLESFETLSTGIYFRHLLNPTAEDV